MALVLNLKCVENLHGKADRIARVKFRGHTQHSRLVRAAKRVAYFGQTFEWPIAREIEGDDVVTIEILNYNKYLNNKVVGSYALSLQQVCHDGKLQINESLTDLNNRLIETHITFDVQYFSPDGRVGQWGEEEFVYPLTDDNLDDDEEDEESVFGSGTRSGRTLPSALHATQTLRMLDETDSRDLLPPDLLDRAGDMPGEDTVSQTLMMDAMFKGTKKRMDQIEQEMHKPRDFQISVRVIEGQQMAGLDIDPVVKVQIGTQHKYTNIKQSTNCPFFDEYFVFDFRESPASIFDKMITITAYHAYGIPGRNVLKATNTIAGKRVIGVFKCDVATVYGAPNHLYYHKWAVLIDPKDMGEGPKGYVKCDISVVGKGDIVKTPKGISEEETNNIEGNLLLPAGISKNRENAAYSINIYRAEDLPRTDYGVMASVRKALSRGPIAFVDAYVKVSLAGHVGKTTVKKSYNPEWKQSIKFMDKFPPLCNRIKVQLYDSDAVKDESIGTHFVELSQIMDPGGDADGILPTFGPSWVNFYGAPRNYKVITEHDDLNVGLGEGSAYRGRLLMSIQTQILKENVGGSQVIREKLMRTGSLMENQPRKEFVLFATIFDATMIDKELRDKPIYFEISIGHYGNTLDGRPNLKPGVDPAAQSESESEDEDAGASLIRKRKEEEKKLPCHSTTSPEIPKTMDKNYYYLPFEGEKPCLYVYSMYEDMRKRLYHTNIMEKIADNLDEGLDDVKQMMKIEYDNTHQRLRGVLKQFEDDCQNYIGKCETPMLKATQGVGRTDLDKYRLKMCKNKVDRFKTQSQKVRARVSKLNISQRFRDVKDISRKLRLLSKDPQHSIPDVFIWMVCEKKRIAYHRIPAKDIIYANTRDFIGKHCGKMQSIFLRKPGKKSVGPAGWAMQAQLHVHFWLGENDAKSKQLYMENIPPGYEIRRSHEPELPPKAIVYKEKHKFQVRAYLYQARSLIGSDDTGLSDPFARVIIGNQCKSTQYIDETLSPTWDESLIFQDLTLYGPLTNILQNPPLIITEIYDYDTVGQPEFLGRAIVKPKVKTENEMYEEPEWPAPLEWHEVYRGPRNAGELLAAYELLQGEGKELPPMPTTERRKRGLIVPLPKIITPALARFRVEVMFWGVREPKRIQLLAVDKPRADIEMAGRVLSSTKIENMDKNSNFDDPIQYMDVDLPENEMFWPPITIRVVDCRKFGRDVLVGVATLTNVQKYIWVPPEERARQQEELRKKKLQMLPVSERMRQARIQDMSDQQRLQLELVTSAIAKGVPMSPSTSPSIIESIRSGGNNNNSKRNTLNGSVKSGPASVNGSVIIPMPQEDATSLRSRRGAMPAPPGIALAGVAYPSQVAVAMENQGHTLPPITEMPPVGYEQPGGAPGAVITTQPGKPGAMPVDKKKIAGKKRKELISDLDWWSKYYVTKEDMDKAEKEKKKKNKGGDDFSCDVIDYEGFDNDKVAELKEMAPSTDEDDPKSKKKKKKDKKKKKKKKKPKWVHPKDALQNMKGKINHAFHKDDDEEDSGGDEVIDVDDVEEMEDKSIIARITIYQNELEKLKDFGSFEEWVQSFDLYRGKKIDDEEDDSTRIAGRFKGTLSIYKLKDDEEDKKKPELKLQASMPNHKPFEVKIMIYIVRALDLHPVDANGKADPYLIVKCGRKEVNDKENRQNNQLNPVFGKLMEFDLVFPMDSYLQIQVMDYDRLSADDLIGETFLDLENRYFSKHRPRCGLQDQYEEYGYNQWRDPMKPTQILEKLCTDHNLNPPKYSKDCVHVDGTHAFYATGEVEIDTGEIRPSNEPIALEALKHFDDVVPDCPLVPEYLETRSLYIPERPGVEQGKVEMWVDMFPKDMPQPSVTVDITPRQPKSYELRCIIWNTDEVVLDDSNVLTGESSSDIFIKGYLKGIGQDDQSTDVHYRSLTGEGNFNWRFIYPFDYLKAEERIVYQTKGSVFDTADTEYKVPAKLTLQVWDADLISADDFLGYITVDLNRIPRPFKDAKKCNEKWMTKILNKDSSIPTINLFKSPKGCRGWWPMVAKDKDGGEDELVGKVEAELQLLTAEEAERNPAGLGRSEPNPLPEPNRPDTSFLWFMNPFKTCKYIIWKNFKGFFIKLIIFLLLAFFLFLFFYNMPGYTVKKMFGV